MKKILTFFMITILMVSCAKKASYITPAKETVEVGGGSSVEKLVVASDGDYTVEPKADWIKVVKSNGEIAISVDQNPTNSERSGLIALISGDVVVGVTVKQSAPNAAPAVSESATPSAPKPLPAGPMRTLSGKNGGKVRMTININDFNGSQVYIKYNKPLTLTPTYTKCIYNNGNNNFKYDLTLNEYDQYGSWSGTYYVTFTSSNNGHSLVMSGTFESANGTFNAYLSAKY